MENYYTEKETKDMGQTDNAGIDVKRSGQKGRNKKERLFGSSCKKQVELVIKQMVIKIYEDVIDDNEKLEPVEFTDTSRNVNIKGTDNSKKWGEGGPNRC